MRYVIALLLILLCANGYAEDADMSSPFSDVDNNYIFDDLTVKDDATVAGTLTAGTQTVTGDLTLSEDLILDSDTDIELTSTTTNSNVEVFKTQLNTTGTTSDNLGTSWVVKMENDCDTDGVIEYGSMDFTATDVSDGSEDAAFYLRLISAGSITTPFYVDTSTSQFLFDDVYPVIPDNLALTFGSSIDVSQIYDEATLDRWSLYTNANGSSGATIPMFAFFGDQDTSNGTNITANQVIFGVGKGDFNSEADNIYVFKVDEDGDSVVGTVNFGAGTGVNSIVVTCSPAPETLVTGMPIYFTSAAASTGACSVNVNSLGWKPLKKLHDQDIAADDIEAGGIVHAVYDGTNFQMMNPEHN